MKQNDLLPLILDTVGDGVLVFSADGRLSLCNPVAGRLFGDMPATLDEWLSRCQLYAPDDSLCPPADHPALRALLGETVPPTELILRGPQIDEPRWLQITARPLRDERAAHAGALVIIHDATPQKRAELALRESERRFRALFNQTFQFISLLNPDGTLIEANQTVLDFAGVQQSELIEALAWQSLWRTVTPQMRDRLRSAVEEAAAGDLVRCEIELCGAGGATKAVDFSLKPVRDEHGQVTMLIAEGWDMSERKQTEAALRESESTLRSFYDSTTLMLGIVELLDDDDILYISNNASAATFFGVSAGDADQRRASELRLSRRYRRIWIEHYRESERTGRPVTVEYEQQIGERTIWLAATVCPIAQSPTARTRFAYVAEDVTERKRTAERISASLREKEVMLQEIHHRVKNNLQVISSLLKLQSSSISDARALEMFQESQHRVRSMALVHEKLYQAADLARIDFADYLKSLTTYLIRSYNISPLLRLEIQADQPVLLDVEKAVPLGLIVNELVTNALKYAFPANMRGQIAVAVHAVADDHLRLTVSDTGVGLPPEIDLGRTETLGLRLVTMLTRQLQGTVALETSQGTTFTLSI